MKRYNLCLIAATVLVSTVSMADAAGPNLDIVGIKVGMSEQDALAAFKAHNPRLVLVQPTHQVAGFTELIQPSASGMVTAERYVRRRKC